MRRWTYIFLTVCASCIGARPAWAWSNKEHIQLTRIAAERLIANPHTPPGMREWLRASCLPKLLTDDQEHDYFLKQRVGLVPRGVDGIAYWATVPDTMAQVGGAGENERKVEPF